MLSHYTQTLVAILRNSLAKGWSDVLQWWNRTKRQGEGHRSTITVLQEKGVFSVNDLKKAVVCVMLSALRL